MKTAKALASVVVVFLLGAVYFVNYTAIPDPIPEFTVAGKLVAAENAGFETEVVTLVDSSRATNANGDYAGSDQREFEVQVWYPKTRAEAGPLLVYSHGFTSNGEGGEYMAQKLADLGYVVAAPTFPLTNMQAPGGPNAADVANQPGDVSFVIDTLLERNADANDVLYQSIDADKIGAMGVSLGGMTTTLVAYHPGMSDERIRAAVSIAGPTYLFTKRFFDRRELPFMMVASPQDALIPYDDNAANIRDKIPGSILVTIGGGSHTGFSTPSRWLRWMRNPDSLGCAAVMDSVDLEDEEGWYHLLGDDSMGVLSPEPPDMCSADPLPRTINPIRQQEITMVAVYQFFQCQFLQEKASRGFACGYLKNDLEREVFGVSVDV